MTTFVLVAGAWHGGWCWEHVTVRLRAAGHTVRTPTLSGMSGTPDPAVGLHTHADDLVRLLCDEDLGDVVLVGHSYAGLVVREAADRVPERVARLVLLDAWAGRDGVSLDDLAPPPFAGWVERNTGDGLIAVPPARMVGVTDPAQVAWLEARLVPQPRRTFAEPTRLTGAVDGIDCRAIVCTPDNGMPFGRWAADFGWPVTPIATGHDAMVTAPDELTRLLLA
ncbi:MAG TPA: alpha/beta fold hydrolase [Actinocatenispora sp.]